MTRRIRPGLPWKLMRRHLNIDVSVVPYSKPERIDTLRYFDRINGVPVYEVRHSGNGLYQCSDCGYTFRGAHKAVEHLLEKAENNKFEVIDGIT